MNEPRMLSPEEIDVLSGQSFEAVAAGMDAFAFRTEDGRTFMAAMCLSCGGHVNYYEIDPSLLATGADYEAA